MAASNHNKEIYIKIVDFIHQEGPKTREELCEYLEIPLNTISSYLDDLINEGTLKRKKIHDENSTRHPRYQYQIRKDLPTLIRKEFLKKIKHSTLSSEQKMELLYKHVQSYGITRSYGDFCYMLSSIPQEKIFENCPDAKKKEIEKFLKNANRITQSYKMINHLKYEIMLDTITTAIDTGLIVDLISKIESHPPPKEFYKSLEPQLGKFTTIGKDENKS